MENKEVKHDIPTDIWRSLTVEYPNYLPVFFGLLGNTPITNDSNLKNEINEYAQEQSKLSNI